MLQLLELGSMPASLWKVTAILNIGVCMWSFWSVHWSSAAHKSNRNEGNIHREHYLGQKRQCSFSAEAVSESYGTVYRTELSVHWATTTASCYKKVMKWPARELARTSIHHYPTFRCPTRKENVIILFLLVCIVYYEIVIQNCLSWMMA